MNETTTIPTAALSLVLCLVCFGICYAGALRAGFGENRSFIFLCILTVLFGLGFGFSVVWLFVP